VENTTREQTAEVKNPQGIAKYDLREKNEKKDKIYRFQVKHQRRHGFVAESAPHMGVHF
jgi:hypothetical protein